MKCYHCGSPVRPSTIICPVCNRQQNQSALERLSEYVKERFVKSSAQKRSSLIYR